MSQPTRYLPMGKIGKPFGVKGWVKVTSYTDPIDQLLAYSPWYHQHKPSADWQPLAVDDAKAQGKGLVIHIKDSNTPDMARLYTNQLIAIERIQLPALAAGEYYWCDLEGLTVSNQQGHVLGVIDYLFTTPSNDVMVVKGEQLHYIPYIKDDFVMDIDLEKGGMVVAWND